jgi:hypothetical protein
MPIKLYELNAAYQHLLDECREYASEHEGEIPNDLAMRLEAVELARDEKIENTVRYYKNENAMAVMLVGEIDALKKRLSTHENNAEWSKQYLASIVKPKEKIEFATGKIGWRESVSANIVDFAKIPDKFQRVIPERREPDKIAIKDALKAGEVVDGAELVVKQNIQVK